MTVLVQLSVAGTNTTLFNIYSNFDNVTPIATGVTKLELLEGYYVSPVPNGATTLRVMATGTCTSYTDMPISGLTTTTTTTATPTTTTSTTVTPTTSTTSTSTSTSTSTTTATPTTTTTTTTLTCLGYTINVNNPLSSATVNFTECNGDSSSLSVGFGVGYDSLPFCAKDGQYTVIGDGYVDYTGVCIHTYLLSSPGKSSRILACAETTYPLTVYSDTFPIVDSTILYTNNTGGVLSTPVVGANLWYQSFIDTLTFQIGNDGVVSNASLCV